MGTTLLSSHRTTRLLAAFLFASGMMLCGISVAFAITTPPKPILPNGPGKEAVEASCQKCHAPNVITAKRKTRDEWVQTVFKMRGLGAEVFDDDIDTISTYLATHFGPWVNVNKATNQELRSAFSLTPEEAGAIVKYRADHGDFKTIEDLLKVSGVDVTKIQVQSDNIAFQDLPVAAEPTPVAPKKN